MKARANVGPGAPEALPLLPRAANLAAMSRRAINIIAIAGGLLVLGVGVPLLVGQVNSLPGGGALAARADERIVTLQVAGMTCEGCVGAVQAELATTAGVSTAEVRLEQERAYVVVSPDVPDSALTGAVSRAGPGFFARVVLK